MAQQQLATGIGKKGMIGNNDHSVMLYGREPCVFADYILIGASSHCIQKAN
jgi:hypothetical protein